MIKNLYSAIVGNPEALGGKNVFFHDAVKKMSFHSVAFLKVAKVSELTFSGNEFQTVLVATEKARLAKRFGKHRRNLGET